jgi:CHASE3 domain sensor protein
MPKSRLRLRRRVQLLALAFVALIGLDVLAAVQLTVVRDRTARLVENKLSPARAEVAAALNSLISQAKGQRDYLITGAPQQLDAYLTGRSTTARSLKRVRELIATEGALVQGVDEASQAVMRWQDEVAQPEIAAKQSGRSVDAATLVAAEGGARRFEAATNTIDALRRGVNTKLNEAEVQRDRSRALTTRVLVASLVIGLGIAVVTRFLIGRWITQPLDELRRSVAQVAGGDLDHQIEPVGPPDLSEVAVGVEAMRRRILTELDDADRARGALARRGLVVLTLRDELAASKTPLPEGWVVASRFDPAEGILAGDWWDLMALRDTRLALALVDVAGHGAATGVFALRTKQLVLAALRQGYDPGAAWSWVHDHLGEVGDQFLTGVAVTIDPATGACRWASAGHPEMLLVAPNGKDVELLEATGPIVGPIPPGWTTSDAMIPPGGILLAYTDGLTEARDDDGDQFGVDRLVDVVRGAAKGGDPAAIADACMAAARRHSAGGFLDDVTVVAVGRSRT